ncbi:MAG TPA: helix-turn-helix transcriptional regulator [Solirubrobacterales bacterium]|jgi:transcriptional regulator with XRE-family HTH domain|nr:helix-turn-helix transcriptional regulator [Solirubrobacterales bacterium]
MPPPRKVPPLSAEHKALGDVLLKLRRRADLTQEQLAELAETDLKQVGCIERGTRNPSYSTLVRLAVALGTRVGTITVKADRLFDSRKRRLARD